MMAAYGMICACVLNGMEPQTVTPFTEQEEGRKRDIPYCVSYAVGVGDGLGGRKWEETN